MTTCATLKRRHLLAGLMTAPLCATSLSAQDPPKACLLDEETNARLNDWANLGKYAAENEKIILFEKPVDIVFMGDSITQGWPDKRPGFFSERRVCRGIGGQTSGQMVLRMMADVVALKPQIVHIMAGTNDIAGNTGPMTPQQTVDNVDMMAVIARAHGIDVLIGSIPPAANFPWRPGLETVQSIASLNRALAALARARDVTFVDYTDILSDSSGGMKAGFAYDGVHPDSAGYSAMESLLEPVIIETMQKKMRK